MTVTSADLRAAAQLARDARPTIREIATIKRPRDYKGRWRGFRVSIGTMHGCDPILVIETIGNGQCRQSRINIRDDDEIEALERALEAWRATKEGARR